MKKRCHWAEKDAAMQEYHDTIWGVPLYDDQRLFRKLVLDINQAGLSWQTILNKQESFDDAYDYFDIETVAKYDKEKIDALLNNPEIIRNRRKIEAAIHNAKIVKEIQIEFGSFSDYLWGFSQYRIVNNTYQNQKEIPTTNELSDKISSDLKTRECKFIGSTIIYAFLEAVGIINDHVSTCFRHNEVNQKKHVE